MNAGPLFLPARRIGAGVVTPPEGGGGGGTGGGGTTVVPTIDTLALRPWRTPTLDAFRTSPLKWGIHNMANWRPSIDNKDRRVDLTEYYARVWGPPGAVEGTFDHSRYGGFVRNMPLPRPVLPGSGTPGAGGWTLTDKRFEVRHQLAAGITHQMIDWLGADTLGHAIEWAQAALEEGAPGSTIIMPDAGASIVRNGPLNLSQKVFDAARGPWGDGFARHTDGRLLIMPYGPELACDRAAKPATATTAAVPAYTATEAEVIEYWRAFCADMDARGEPVALWPVFTRAWRDVTQRTGYTFTKATLKPWVVGVGRWGGATPGSVLDPGVDNAGAEAFAEATWGLPYCHAARVEDARPDQGVYSEAEGWGLWDANRQVIPARLDGSDIVQGITGNDYREGTAMAPSVFHGFCDLDVYSYTTIAARFGPPPIEKDGVYLAHRVQLTPDQSPQPAYTTAVSTYTKKMALTAGRAGINVVDALVFLTAPADLTVSTSAGKSTPQRLPAGVSRFSVPLAPGPAGSISASVVRAGVGNVASVTSPFEVNYTQQVSQDLDYRRVSSFAGRGGAPTLARAA